VEPKGADIDKFSGSWKAGVHWAGAERAAWAAAQMSL